MENTKNADKGVVIVSGSSGLIGTALINELAKFSFCCKSFKVKNLKKL